MSDTFNAIVSLIKTFQKYSGQEGDKFTLTNKELRALLQAELGELLPQGDQTRVDKIFHDLDHDKSGTVDFQEYMILIASITMVCHDFFKEAK